MKKIFEHFALRLPPTMCPDVGRNDGKDAISREIRKLK